MVAGSSGPWPFRFLVSNSSNAFGGLPRSPRANSFLGPIGLGFGQFRAIRGRRADGSKLRVERLRCSSVAGGLRCGSGAKQTVEAVRGKLQRSFVLGEGVGGAPQFK